MRRLNWTVGYECALPDTPAESAIGHDPANHHICALHCHKLSTCDFEVVENYSTEADWSYWIGIAFAALSTQDKAITGFQGGAPGLTVEFAKFAPNSYVPIGILIGWLFWVGTSMFPI